MTIYIATGNRHKAEEFARIFSDHRVVLPADHGIAFDPEETGESFFENALIKAQALFDLVHEPVLADDSGICVDALCGAPGIRSARFGSTEGKELCAEERNALLLDQLSGVTERSARFVCNLVLYLGKDRYISVQETLEGEIVSDRGSGTGGFGYDPVLYLAEFGKTVAELDPELKDRVSHRGKAAKQMQFFLEKEK